MAAKDEGSRRQSAKQGLQRFKGSTVDIYGNEIMPECEEFPISHAGREVTPDLPTRAIRGGRQQRRGWFSSTEGE